jgi:uncharacterized protein YeaO (DUF488 family)
MAIRIVRLGTPRHRNEGLRLGTVRRPPRGVRKAAYARENWFDIWFPTLAPTLATMKLGLNAANDAEWRRFLRQYRTEMREPAAAHALALLAAFSHEANFSVGCYCDDAARCHRSELRNLLVEAGASVSEKRA